MVSKINARFFLFQILILLLIFNSCQKELSLEDGDLFSLPNNDFKTEVITSVSGFIVDENNDPIPDASIEFGGASILTDNYGFFEFTNKSVVQNAAVVKITKPGFFTMVKTFIAVKDKAGFFRIKLIQKTIAGTINATTGGTINYSGNVTINFPADAFINTNTGVNYNGTVQVAVNWIDPTSNELQKLMPGDLRGIDTSGNVKHLTTYGMIDVELTGTGGEQLNLGNNKKAIISTQIPAAILSFAPASIPLWHFNESKGLWKEEGNAIKTGNNYVGQVSHFSPWNYDVPANSVILSGTITGLKGIPISNALIKISSVANLNSFSLVYTDITGYFRIAVRENTNLKLEILGESNCNSAIFARLITSTTQNISLGVLVVNVTADIAYIHGAVKDCNNNAVSKGSLLMLKDNQFYKYPILNDGVFGFTTLLCNGMGNIKLIAINSVSQQQGSTAVLPIVTGDNIIGNILACGLSTAEFVHFSIDGVPGGFDAPADTIWQPSNIYFHVVGRRSLPTFEVFSISFDTAGIGYGSLQRLIGASGTLLSGPTQVLPNPVFVQITEYGSIGQFVSGNFSGNIRDVNPPNQIHQVTGNFRVRRTQ